MRPSGGRPQVKRANRGSEVRLVCEAVGKGTPKIVWRYNWGFVTARHTIEERCIDPDTDISTLILSSVDVRDAGIYTCEALNNQGRAFGEDYVVEVNGESIVVNKLTIAGISPLRVRSSHFIGRC